MDSSSVRAVHGGEKIAPNSTDRRKGGSKHHIITDTEGTPLAVLLTEANRNAITVLIPLAQTIPPVKGKPYQPKSKPERA